MMIVNGMHVHLEREFQDTFKTLSAQWNAQGEF